MYLTLLTRTSFCLLPEPMLRLLLTCEEYPLKKEYQKWTSVKAKFLKKK